MPRGISSVSAACLLTAGFLWAQPPGPPSVKGLDWNTDAITVTGIGQPPPNPANLAQARAMTIRGALGAAAQNLMTIIQAIPIQGDATVGGLMETNEAVREKIESLIKGAWQSGPPNYRPDGSIELTVFVKRSHVAASVLPEGGFADSMPPPGSPPAGAHSGLLIDARGVGLSSALACRVLDDKGREVYGPGLVTREYAVRNGVVAYGREPLKDRVGGNPLQVKGSGLAGANRTDVILSAEDAERVRSASQVGNFLSQGRVFILID